MSLSRLLGLAGFFLAGCASPVAADPWLTILDAPPASFVPEVPGTVEKTTEQVAAERRFSDYARWQGGVQGVAFTVHNHLKVAEKGNYVDMRFADENGRFAVVYSFLRDGPTTLRKYMQRPDFVGETVRWSKAEQEKAGLVMLAFFKRHRIAAEGGWGNAENRPVFQVGVTQNEFDALVRKDGFRVPEPVLLTFAERSAAEINGPLPPDIARGIRLFARQSQPLGAVPDVSRNVTVVLKDGCFRLKEGGAHVVFPLGYTLHRDAEGFLTFGSATDRGHARVGEEAQMHGIPFEVQDEGVVREVRAACGEGRVIAVNALKSAAAEGAREQARERRWTSQILRDDYGFSERGIAAYFADCKQRGVPCGFYPPPPPRPCPAGTLPDRGQNCRDSAGRVRPVPEHLKPFESL